MTSLRSGILRIGGVTAALAASATLFAPMADAAPKTVGGWNFDITTVRSGVTAGAELAIDPGRRKLFITDSDAYMSTKGGTNATINPHALNPKVVVFDINRKAPVRSISYAGQPIGVMPFGPIPVLPMPQVPDGISVDPVHGRILTSQSHVGGVTVVGMGASTTDARNLIDLSTAHPMGSVIDSRTGRGYVGLNSSNEVLVLNTATRREITRIRNVYAPSFLALDASRNRLYVGNADYYNKRTNYLTVVDVKSNRIIKKIPTPSNSRPAVDPTTGRVFAASFDTGKISVIDPNSLTVVKTISTGSTPNKIVVDANRRLVYTSNLQKRSFTVINADTASVIGTVPAGAPVHSLVVDPVTGTVYATQHQSGNLTVMKVSKR